jgi:nitroimidazol reductase NimA-like FMN-containing flavoprotein (pyridoxamine 5'-phosphate oxidase superfamily)
MFIHEMTKEECTDALKRANFGRLACARDNQPYVVPINFAFDGRYLYGFTTLGQKVEWMRSNPSVCFEVDEVKNHNHWMSVIVFGRYEELRDTPENQMARRQAHALLQKRVMWWEPAYISQEHRDQAHSLTPIFFRIRVDKVTGHRANSDGVEDTATAAANVLSDEPGMSRRLLQSQSIRTLKAAIAYFAIVFGAGFVLGPIRILFAVPRVGERVAELLEAPLMFMVIVLAARWIVRRFQLPARAVFRLGAGLIALVLGIVFEFTLVLTLRGLTLAEYFATRDPIAATVYYFTLVLFALMPLLLIKHGLTGRTKA